MFCQPIYHMIAAKVYRPGGVAEVTAWGRAPTYEHET